MTPAELNIYIECYTEKQKEKQQAEISYAFYSAYFNLKGQKGLSGKDLKTVIDSLNNKADKLDDLEIYKKVVAINSKIGGA